MHRPISRPRYRLMTINFVSVRPHSRSRGHSAARALAYRVRGRLYDSHSGQMHDYRRHQPAVIQSGIAAPRGCPLTDLQRLADAVEASERRWDARLGRDIQVGIPNELIRYDQIALIEDFADMLLARYQTVVPWAIHPANSARDIRNVHAHLWLPARALDPNQLDQFGGKLRRLDSLKSGPAEIVAIRNIWGDTANAYLIRASQPERVNIGIRQEGPSMSSPSPPNPSPEHFSNSRGSRRL